MAIWLKKLSLLLATGEVFTLYSDVHRDQICTAGHRPLPCLASHSNLKLMHGCVVSITGVAQFIGTFSIDHHIQMAL